MADTMSRHTFIPRSPRLQIKVLQGSESSNKNTLVQAMASTMSRLNMSPRSRLQEQCFADAAGEGVCPMDSCLAESLRSPTPAHSEQSMGSVRSQDTDASHKMSGAAITISLWDGHPPLHPGLGDWMSCYLAQQGPGRGGGVLLKIVSPQAPIISTAAYPRSM